MSESILMAKMAGINAGMKAPKGFSEKILADFQKCKRYRKNGENPVKCRVENVCREDEDVADGQKMIKK